MFLHAHNMHTGVRPRYTTWIQGAVALAVIAGALVPAGASAAVTRSSVLTPADPFFRVYEPDAKALKTVTVSGTTDGRAGDGVDLLCGQDAVATNIAVQKDGRFSAEVPLKGLAGSACTLRAVPEKFRGKELDAFTGPFAAVTVFSAAAEKVPVRGSERTVALDYLVQTAHRTGVSDVRSAASSALIRDVWEGAFVGTELKADRNGIEVDGHAAYAAAEIPRYERDGRPEAPAGFEGVEAMLALDQRTGDVTITEREKIVRCSGTDTTNPPQERCQDVLDTGIRLERTIALTDEHAIASVQDRWLSTDGRPHALRVTYVHSAFAPVLATEHPLWRAAREPQFAARERGDTLAANGPGTLLVRSTDAVASLSYDPAPARFVFATPETLHDVVEVAIPAGGAAPVRRVFALGDVTVQETQDVDPPIVTIEAGTTLTALPSIEVYGRASDDVGVVRLTINGQDVAVGAGGAYTATIALALGENRLTAIATDAAGKSASAAMVVTRSGVDPKPQPEGTEFCTVPKVKAGTTVTAARAKLAKANCRVAKTTKAVRSSKVRKGRVVRLSVKAGSSFAKADKAVRIEVSRGKRR